MKEIWKDVVGYEEYYSVSNLWNIKSKDKKRIHNIHKKEYVKRWIIMSINKRNKKQEYLSISLTKWGTRKSFYIHRLVWLAFLKRKPCYKYINHIDWNPKNNRVDNLEWCNHSQNVLHSFKNLNRKVLKWKLHPKPFLWKKGKNHPNSKEVNCYTLDWIFVKTYYWISEAERCLGISGISNCVTWQSKTCWGYIWRYRQK